MRPPPSAPLPTRFRAGRFFALASLLAGCLGGDSPLPDDPFFLEPEPDPGGLEERRRVLVEDAVIAESPPPPISGGTLEVSADETHAFASDPDRDAVWIIDVTTKQPVRVDLSEGAEPGRIAEGPGGTFFVALRRGGAVAQVDVTEARLVATWPICAAPRGLHYDGASDQLRVACAGGELVTLRGSDGAEVRRTLLLPDLRDVVVDGARTLVSRFRTAEILVLDGDDKVQRTLTPEDPRFEQPTFAWRMRALPGGGVVVSHQFAQKAAKDVETESGSYGGVDCDGPIVGTALSVVQDGRVLASALTAPMPVPVDVVLRPAQFRDAQATLVTVSAGSINENNPISGFEAGVTLGVFAQEFFSLADVAANPERADEIFPDPGFCEFGVGAGFADDGRQVTAAAALTDGTLVYQSRDPWAVQFVRPWRDGVGIVVEYVALPGAERKDSGHDLFHEESGNGIACASCHAEGGEDGVAWRFADLGALRTQDLRGGILGTEPFHWGGDQADLKTLLDEVMFERMAGPKVPDDHRDALGRWLDALPAAPKVSGLNPSAIARGKALFEAQDTGCATCHGDGARTLVGSVDVGTGQPLQVPRLTGVGMRAPLMHDGCAETLEARFTDPACGGGEAHGKTAHLSEAELVDLVSYLESL